MRSARFLCLAACLFAALIPAMAQQATSIRGQVTDPTGAIVAGATVTLESLTTGGGREVSTDQIGSYRLLQLEPGVYRLRVQKPGFRTVQRESVSLLVGVASTINVTLELGDVEERITVRADEAPILNTVDATLGHAISEQEVKRLPLLARNPVNLLSLQPGVVFTGGSDTDLLFLGGIRQGGSSGPGSLDPRDGSINGVTSNQNNVRVDGADSNDWFTQSAFTTTLPVTLDSLQEFRVVTTNATADDGVSAGAQVKLVTKSGSNEWHGNARWYNRDDALAANAFFNNRAGIAKPKLQRNILGGSLGGPMLRNRAFFFLDYEGRRDDSEQTVVRYVPIDDYRAGILRFRTQAGNIRTLTPADLRAADPAGLGVNANVLQALSLYPKGNDSSIGDGLATTGFRFNAPTKTESDIFTARLDFNLVRSGAHRLFARGSGADIALDTEPAPFPGSPAASRLLNKSKGFVTGYTGLFGASITNSAHVSLTRQAIRQTGIQSPNYSLDFSSLASTEPSDQRTVPVWQFSDDLTWIRGRHTFQFGGTARTIRMDRQSFTSAFPEYATNTPVNQLPDDGDPTNDPLDPDDFSARYGNLLGAIQLQFGPLVVLDPKTGRFLAAGSPLSRKWAENHFEGYFQDNWRLTSNLSLTAGLRYVYHTPIWEQNGGQIRPTVDLKTWWQERLDNARNGIPTDAQPDFIFEAAGRANNAESYWKPDRNNVAPRVALTWSPRFNGRAGKLLGTSGTSVFRAGFGVDYHRAGGIIAFMEDAVGNGLSSDLLRNQVIPDLKNSPRFSGNCTLGGGCTGFPSFAALNVPDPQPIVLPGGPNRRTFRSTFQADEGLRTPYTVKADFSFQREIARGTVLDVAYVGSFGRDLINRLNLAHVMNVFTDPASKQTFQDAMKAVGSMMGSNFFSPAIDPFNKTAVQSGVRPIQFVENLLPRLPAQLVARSGSFYDGLTPSQAFYAMIARQRGEFIGPIRTGFDNPPTPFSPWAPSVDPQGDGRVLWPGQFSNISTVMNVGRSNYHSFQLSARRNVGQHVFGINYVLSKATDINSRSENSDFLLFDSLAFENNVPDPFSPGRNKSRADFDVRHNFNAHWVAELPFGRDSVVGRNAGPILDRLIGGWQLTGIWRWRSGFPLAIRPRNRALIELVAEPPLSGPVSSEVVRNGVKGSPNLFADPDAVASRVQFSSFGETGPRNPLTGPAYFNVDLSLHKRVRVPGSENHFAEFRITAFNAFNNVNFSAFDIDRDPVSASFGQIRSTAGPRGGSREVEIAVRYSF
jgi:hypothetical protein